MLAPQGRLFGTNGVRFIPGVTGDMSFALKLAESIGTYLDWTFKKAKEDNQFRDVVFVGCKPGTSSI